MPTITHETPRAAPQPAQDAADPFTRYFRRVDEHLESQPRPYHLPFLRAQRNRFIQAYGDFVADVDNGIDRPGETAADYVTIIAELGKRLAAEEAAHGQHQEERQ